MEVSPGGVPQAFSHLLIDPVGPVVEEGLAVIALVVQLGGVDGLLHELVEVHGLDLVAALRGELAGGAVHGSQAGLSLIGVRPYDQGEFA